MEIKGYLWKCEFEDSFGQQKSEYLISETDTITSATSLYRKESINNLELCDGSDIYFICGATASFEAVKRVDYNRSKKITLYCKKDETNTHVNVIEVESAVYDSSFIPNITGDIYEFIFPNGQTQVMEVGKEYVAKDFDGTEETLVFDGIFAGDFDESDNLVGIKPSAKGQCGSIVFYKDVFTGEMREQDGLC